VVCRTATILQPESTGGAWESVSMWCNSLSLLAPRVGIEPTTNGLTGRRNRSERDPVVRNQALRWHLVRENPVQYTPVRLAGKQVGNISARAKSRGYTQLGELISTPSTSLSIPGSRCVRDPAPAATRPGRLDLDGNRRSVQVCRVKRPETSTGADTECEAIVAPMMDWTGQVRFPSKIKSLGRAKNRP
jgi:hypothetical protein